MSYRIVVPLDGSGFGEHAIPVALTVAERTAGTLNLVTVALPVSDGSVSGSDVAGEAFLERGVKHGEAYLKEMVARIRAAGFTGSIHQDVMPAGNAARTLVRHIADLEADLVVMTTHGHGPVRRVWLGSTTDGVIRRSPCPVLILRPPGASGEDQEAAVPVDLAARPDPFQIVVIPLDGSEAAERGMDPLPKLLPADPPATLQMVRVVPPFISAGSPYLPMAIREMHEHELVEEAALAYLDRVQVRLQASGLLTEAHVTMAGQPVASILALAEEKDATLIAMSTSGRGGAARLLLGSVADKVIRGASCPVLLSRTPEDA